MKTVTFEKEDRAQFHFAITEDKDTAQLVWATVGRVPFFNVVRPPAIRWNLPRQQLITAVANAVKTLPVAAQSGAEAALRFVVDLMEQSAGADVALTFGDRTPDGKLDVTIEVSGQLPGSEMMTLDPVTITPPIGEVVDAVGTASMALAAAIPLPGAPVAVGIAFAVFKAALHALKIA